MHQFLSHFSGLLFRCFDSATGVDSPTKRRHVASLVNTRYSIRGNRFIVLFGWTADGLYVSGCLSDDVGRRFLNRVRRHPVAKDSKLVTRSTWCRKPPKGKTSGQAPYENLYPTTKLHLRQKSLQHKAATAKPLICVIFPLLLAIHSFRHESTG